MGRQETDEETWLLEKPDIVEAYEEGEDEDCVVLW